MGVPSGGDLLDLWEQADGLDPARQALVLAAAADQSSAPKELSALPVGQRDARLLSLRVAMAGPNLEATAMCASCSELVEFSIDALALLDVTASGGGPHTTVVDGISVTWRCPTSDDLAHLASLDDSAPAEAVLFQRCILDVTGTRPVTASDLPPGVRAAVTEAMGDADPLAEILVDLTCANCGSQFTAEVDVAAFTWTELKACAHRLLREIDVLARVYGWTEREVLELSTARRAAYLELAMHRS